MKLITAPVSVGDAQAITGVVAMKSSPGQAPIVCMYEEYHQADMDTAADCSDGQRCQIMDEEDKRGKIRKDIPAAQTGKKRTSPS